MSPATKPRTEPFTMGPQAAPYPGPTKSALVEDREAPLPQHETLLREIAEDARREPERFLADSRVPEGGE